MRVSPTLARSMQELACTSTPSSSTAGPDCVIFSQRCSQCSVRAKPKPSLPTMAPFCRMTSSPRRQYSRTTAWAWAKNRLPMRHSAIDHDMRQKNGVVADLNIVIDHNVGGDMGIRADFRGRRNHRGGMNHGLVSWQLVKQVDRARESEIWILAAQHPGWNRRKGIRDDYRCGRRVLGCGSIFWVGDEGDLLGASFFDARQHR